MRLSRLFIKGKVFSLNIQIKPRLIKIRVLEQVSLKLKGTYKP
jgi:hypothetical protein